jgi:hypothetical protein
MNKHIQTLLIERDGYRRRGLIERVEAVDEALAALGYRAIDIETMTVEPSTEQAKRKSPRRRKKD